MRALVAALFVAPCLGSVAFAATPELTSQAEPEPDYDFTLGISGGLADVGLEFGFRVTEHFAWSFDLGVAWIDEVGIAAGVGLQYFVADDFRGFYIGFGGQFATYVDNDAREDYALWDAGHIGAFFGTKWIIDPGFTVEFSVGPSLRYRSNIGSVNGVDVTTTSLAPALDGKLVVGWSF